MDHSAAPLLDALTGYHAHARGLLSGFHRLYGTADLTLQEAVAMLRDAGHAALAGDIEQTLAGRDIISGCWSFQLIEAYDTGYWNVFRDVEEHARAELAVPARHVFKAEMKARAARSRRQQPRGALAVSPELPGLRMDEVESAG